MDTSITNYRAATRWKSRGIVALSLVLAAVLLILALRGVSWRDMRTAVQRGRPGFLVLALSLMSLSLFMRGLRWGVLIRADKRISPLIAFWATMIGYIGNSFLPARAGDVLRPVVTSRVARTSLSYAVAAQITERITDTLALVVLSLIASFSLDAIPGWLLGATEVMGVLAVIGVTVLALAPRLEGTLQRLLRRLPLPSTMSNRLIGLLQRFLLGMHALRQPKRALLFFALTATVWVLDDFTAVAVAWSLRAPVAWQEAMLLLVALGLASAIPSTPGYVGIFQFVAVTVLVPFGVTRSEAIAYILEFQAILYAAVIIWGAIGVWRMTTMHYLGVRQPLISPSLTSEPDWDTAGYADAREERLLKKPVLWMQRRKNHG